MELEGLKLIPFNYDYFIIDTYFIYPKLLIISIIITFTILVLLINHLRAGILSLFIMTVLTIITNEFLKDIENNRHEQKLKVEITQNDKYQEYINYIEYVINNNEFKSNKLYNQKIKDYEKHLNAEEPNINIDNMLISIKKKNKENLIKEMLKEIKKDDILYKYEYFILIKNIEYIYKNKKD